MSSGVAGSIAAAMAALVFNEPCHALDATAVQAADGRARVTALADRFIAEYQARFPMAFSYVGLPMESHDGIDANSPADIAAWRAFLQGLSGELRSIDPGAFTGAPEWATWYFLDQTLREDTATAVCREEFWSVSAFGWQAGLSQLVGIQPVGSDEARRQALARWQGIGPWIDQEIANLREGQRLGFSATDAAVRSTVAQLDGLLAGDPGESPFMDPAVRDTSPAFVEQWGRVVRGSLWPALARYRAFLRDEYLPKARTRVSIESHPGGRECYRGLIYSTVTIDADPVELFDAAVKMVDAERAAALELGRKIYGEKASNWATLAALMRADPRNRFATVDEVRDYTQATYERAQAAAGRMVLTPPVGRVKLEAFPEHQQASAPGGQYLPAADDGSRVATYFYRNVPQDLYRASLQNVILHETLPGHHLQLQFLAEHGRKGNHPIGRLLFFSGPGEGWATYSEEFAREIGLYDSELEYIGGLMGSITPMMVVDLGMQVKGWTTEQAIAYLQEAMPMRPPERAAQSVATISSLPGFVLAYPMGGVQWQKMRREAQAATGADFDVRAFHQAMLEDGMLPFAALDAKAKRWAADRAQ